MLSPERERNIRGILKKPRGIAMCREAYDALPEILGEIDRLREGCVPCHCETHGQCLQHTDIGDGDYHGKSESR